MSTSSSHPLSPRRDPGNEEPELAFEESIPLDGTDPEGERMIEELGRERRRGKDPSLPADGEPMREQFPAS